MQFCGNDGIFVSQIYLQSPESPLDHLHSLEGLLWVPGTPSCLPEEAATSLRLRDLLLEGEKNRNEIGEIK